SGRRPACQFQWVAAVDRDESRTESICITSGRASDVNRPVRVERRMPFAPHATWAGVSAVGWPREARPIKSFRAPSGRAPGLREAPPGSICGFAAPHAGGAIHPLLHRGSLMTCPSFRAITTITALTASLAAQDWTLAAPGAFTPVRNGACAAYDLIRQEVVMFG